MRKVAVGVDIGGTNTAYGLVDAEGKTYGEGVFSTKDYPDFDLYLQELYIGIKSLVNDSPEEFEIIGVGIGAPNSNHFQGTIEEAPNLPWDRMVPIVDKMKLYFPGIPVILTNDAKAAAIGEMIFGSAKGMKDFIYITLGTGLGSGFISNGKVIYGHDSFAGELGHVIVNRTGRVCGCGRKGCLETYVSATGIKRTVFKLLADHTEPSEFRNVSYNDLTAEMITKAALNGDPIAIEAFDYTALLLGQALADAVAITSPEAIFLFGGLARASKYLFEPTKKYMEMHLLINYRNKIELLPSGLTGMNSAILGASSLIWDELKSAT